MKAKSSILLIVAIIMIGALWPISPVQAAAYGTKFVTSITYVNVGTDDAIITLTLYDSAGVGIDVPLEPLAPNAAASLYVGNITQIASGFQGSASMSSSQPLATTLVQVPQSPSTVKNRPLSNAFTQGSNIVKIPTVLKNVFNTNTIFTVQNVDTVTANVEVKFVPVSGSPVTANISLAPGAAKYYDLGGTSPVTASTFNGSVVLTASTGSLVATSLELSTLNDNTYAFEGVAAGGSKIYMPSAFCNWGAGGAINSAYAVQNVSSSADASVTIQYTSGMSDGPFTIGPGAKRSFLGCAVNPTNFIGAATVTSTGAEVVAMGKITGNGLSTAYVGFAEGNTKVAVPYVRWTQSHWTDGTRQRVNIAIQNVGASSIGAGTLSVKFYDKNGALSGTITNPSSIAVGGKWSTNASSVNAEFGYIGGFGGGAIIESPQAIAVIARVETYLTATTTAGEDYNGIPIQ